MNVFRSDNTEGYTDNQLVELNRMWDAHCGDLDPQSDEGKRAQERVLSVYDTCLERGISPGSVSVF